MFRYQLYKYSDIISTVIAQCFWKLNQKTHKTKKKKRNGEENDLAIWWECSKS